MHRNGFWFHGSHNGSSECCSVSSAFNCDEFASPRLSQCRPTTQSDRQADRQVWIPKLGSAQTTAQSSHCLFALPSSCCLSAGSQQRKHYNNQGKSIHGFRVDLTFPMVWRTKITRWARPRPLVICLQITDLVAFVLPFSGYILSQHHYSNPV